MNDIDILEELIKGAKEYNQYEDNKYYKSIENLISRVKELESIEQIHREDNGKLQEKVTEYEEIDLTQIYLSGIYAERDRWENRIKEKIEETQEVADEDNADEFIRISAWKELLQEER